MAQRSEVNGAEGLGETNGPATARGFQITPRTLLTLKYAKILRASEANASRWEVNETWENVSGIVSLPHFNFDWRVASNGGRLLGYFEQSKVKNAGLRFISPR